MKISITKLTNIDLLRKAASMTLGKESKITWPKALKLGHSLIRTQMYWIELIDIPQSVMGHLVRHVHAQPFVQSKRPDRGAPDFKKEIKFLADEMKIDVALGMPQRMWAMDSHIQHIQNLPKYFGRDAPTSMGLLLNAEEIINISRLRLCSKASVDTRKVWGEVVDHLKDIDPDLALYCVPSCVHQGFCRESPCCGYTKSSIYKAERLRYKKLFDR